MRTLYEVRMAHLSVDREEKNKIYMRTDYYTIYLIHAHSIQDAIDKLPPGEDKERISSVTLWGSAFLIL